MSFDLDGPWDRAKRADDAERRRQGIKRPLTREDREAKLLAAAIAAAASAFLLWLAQMEVTRPGQEWPAVVLALFLLLAAVLIGRTGWQCIRDVIDNED